MVIHDADAAATTATIEILIAAEDPPWRLTFEFLSDLYSVLRQTWLANVADIDDYVFDLTGVANGSKSFKGQLRPRRRRGEAEAIEVEVSVNQRFEFPVGEGQSRRRISAGEALAAGAIVVSSILGPVLTAALSKSPVAELPTVAAPSVHPDRVDRIVRYVRLHAGGVLLRVTNADGSEILVVIGDAQLVEDQHGSDLENVDPLPLIQPESTNSGEK